MIKIPTIITKDGDNILLKPRDRKTITLERVIFDELSYAIKQFEEEEQNGATGVTVTETLVSVAKPRSD